MLGRWSLQLEWTEMVRRNERMTFARRTWGTGVGNAVAEGKRSGCREGGGSYGTKATRSIPNNSLPSDTFDPYSPLPLRNSSTYS
jgi:hypothetical protein